MLLMATKTVEDRIMDGPEVEDQFQDLKKKFSNLNI